MASHDAMNHEDGDADHVAVTQSDMTRATSAALQAAAAQGSAGQRPSPGGSAEMSAEASPQHHQENCLLYKQTYVLERVLKFIS